MILASKPKIFPAILSFLVTMVLTSGVYAAPAVPVATGKPSTLKVTVTKVELFNGTSYVQVFSGSAELDLVTAGTFPGIADLTLPAGTYSQLRVTILNAFKATGHLDNLGTTYYVTSAVDPADLGGSLRTATAVAPGSEATVSNPLWGAAGAPYVLPDFAIGPLVVTPATDYQPTLKFSVDNSLELYQVGLAAFAFTLAAPTVTII
jgi:hypothetical protein